MSTFELAVIGIAIVAAILGAMAVLTDKLTERRHRAHHKHA